MREKIFNSLLLGCLLFVGFGLVATNAQHWWFIWPSYVLSGLGFLTMLAAIAELLDD